MKNSVLIFVVVCLSINQSIFSQDKGIGTKEEAREILDRTVNLMKSNKTVAFAMITAGGQGGLATKDLYPFCTSLSGIQVAHPYGGAGLDMREFTSSDGKKLYDIMVRNAKEGVISKVSYKFGRPEGASLTIKEYTKVAFYTRVGNYICGSGYYTN
tara:strand:+ start:232 stop:699 length:468 start_codon:yes stop_codon:yes gene_type:complete